MSSPYHCPFDRSPLSASHRHVYFYKCGICGKDFARYDLENKKKDQDAANKAVLQKIHEVIVKGV